MTRLSSNSVGQRAGARLIRARQRAAYAWVLSLAVVCAHSAASDVAFKITENKGPAPVADAVVSLVSLEAPMKTTPPAEPIELSQSGQEFSAYVTPIVVGTTVAFPNADKVSHQVYSLSKPTKVFTLPLYKPGHSSSVVFDRPGVVVVGCNIHDWMLAYVVVLETPWFAKTGADGSAVIAGVAPGRYRAEVWHPRLGKSETRELAIAAGVASVQAFTLTLKPDRRIRRTPEAAGGGYK